MDIEHERTDQAWLSKLKCVCGENPVVLTCPLTASFGKAWLADCPRHSQDSVHYHVNCSNCGRSSIRENT